MSNLTEHVALTEAEAARAQQQVEQARVRLEHAEHARRFWDDLLTSLRHGHVAHALLILRREGDFIREARGTDDAVVQRLRAMYGELQTSARVSATNVARDLPSAARSAGIEIDSTSRHPTYTFNQGFLRLELDERNLTAKVAPRDGNAIEIGLDVDHIVETVRSQQSRLFERSLDADVVLRSIYTAYTAVLRAERKAEGYELPLRRVMSRLAKNLNRFAADEFNVDLSRLVQRGDLTVDGKRLHLNHTRDRRQGILLHGLESGGYVGFISFKTESKT